MMLSDICATGSCFSPSCITGKERDGESGNDYFGARYYASNMGRFLSPDWSASDDAQPVPYADLENPQSLNLYSYVQNNPLSHKDENGHFMLPPCGCPDYSGPQQDIEWFFGRLSLGVQLYWQQFFGKKTPVVPPSVGPANTANPNPDDNRPKYDKSSKHGKFKRGNVSAAPKDGQTALDNSVQVKDTSPRRIGVDPANKEIVVLDQTSEGFSTDMSANGAS